MSAHFSRRKLLQCATTATGAGLLWATAQGAPAADAPAEKPAPAAPPAGREVAFYVPGHAPDLVDRLAWLRDQGIRHVGLDGQGGRPKTEDLQRTAQALEQAGMTVVALHGVGALANPQNDSAPLRTGHLNDLERAAAWKAQHLVLHFRHCALPWREGVGYEEATFITKIGLEEYDRRVADHLHWLCDEAARRNVRITLENLPLQHQFSYRMEEIVAMVRRVNAPNLGICLDSGHVHASGLDVVAAIRAAGQHLWTLHLHDNLGGGDPRLPILKTDLHLAVGLGTINWPATIRALDASPYTGPAVFEGVRATPKKAPGDWKAAAALCLANWRAAQSLATELD